jgi:isoleucyl-tRNA synthetase
MYTNSQKTSEQSTSDYNKYFEGPLSENATNEESIVRFWNDNQIFQKTLAKESPKGDFVFFEGPPTANGRPGIHHVLARSFKDIIPRYKTMRGFHVERKAGWDTHGLPVELQVEKQLGLQSKKEIEQLGIAKFNEQCKESVWQYKDEWEQVTRRMGYWLDMQNPYITYSNGYVEALWSVMKKISDRGFLYKDFKILPWCTRCGTALSSHELNQPGAYKEVKDVTAFVKFKVIAGQKIVNNTIDENTYISAWTTTPWTLPGNVALAVGSDIEYVLVEINGEKYILAKDLTKVLDQEFSIINSFKGSEIVGLRYEPLYPFIETLIDDDQKQKLENAFKVYAADFVTTTDGTGIVHIAPMYGADDFDLATKYNLPKFHVVNEEGKYIPSCDTSTIKLSERYVKEVDEKGKPTLAIDIINDLTERNLLLKKENYAHSYPHCWRCDTPLLYYARTSWYFRVSAIREQLVTANKSINWEPEHIRDGRFGEWLEGARDWAISRDRYWGTPIPVWQKESGENIVIGSLAELKKYTKPAKNNYFIIRHGQAENNVSELHNHDIHKTAELTQEGIEQVIKSVQNFKEKIDIMVVSPFTRTKHTAELVCNETGFSPDEIIFDTRIQEWSVSREFHGKQKSEFSQFYNHDYHTESKKHFDDNDESFADVVKRVGDFFTDIEQKYSGKNIFIVAHSGIIRALDFIAKEISFDELSLAENELSIPENAEIRNYKLKTVPRNRNYELDFHKPYIDEIDLFDPETGEKLKRTTEVMDVWFDSGSMPFAQNHKIGQEVDFNPQPAGYISEGVDQTRGWFYTMHTIANLLHEKPTQAYNQVICMGLLLDEKGQKMSKSKGNVVSPWDMFAKYGADVVRFWTYAVNQPGDFKNFDEKSLDEVNKKVFNPLRNVVSFYAMFAPETEKFPWVNPFDSTNVLDRWMLIILKRLAKDLVTNLDNYKVSESARAIREFINELSTWYVRRSRDRFKSDDETDKTFAIVTLQYVLDQLSRYMAPFTPFIAEEVYQKVRILKYEESVHLTTWHTGEFMDESNNENILNSMQKVRDLVTLGFESRQKTNIKVRQPLASITISDENLSSEFTDILKDELNIKNVIIDPLVEKNTVVIDTEITDELRNEGEMRDMIRKVQDMRKVADLVPKDVVIIYLTEIQPSWFVNEIFKNEFITTVGAKEVVWGSSQEKLEVI